MMPDSEGEAGGVHAEPRGDVDDLIFRCEPEEWLISER